MDLLLHVSITDSVDTNNAHNKPFSRAIVFIRSGFAVCTETGKSVYCWISLVYQLGISVLGISVELMKSNVPMNLAAVFTIWRPYLQIFIHKKTTRKYQKYSSSRHLSAL